MLRPYQQLSVDGLRNSIATGHKRPILVASTGSGKTHIAVAIIKSALEKEKTVLFLAPRRELIYQAHDRMKDHGIEAGMIMAGEQREAWHPVQVASFDTLHARGVRRQSMLMPEADLVIVDECFTPETEILTARGFIRFDELTNDDRVAQVGTDDLSLDFVIPDEVIIKDYSGELINIKSKNSVDLTMTPGHELLLSRPTKRIKLPVEDVRFNYMNNMFSAGRSSAEDSELTSHGKLAIAFQADGNLHRECVDGTTIIMFSFSKERKIMEFNSLMEEGGYVFSEVSGRTGTDDIKRKPRQRFSVRRLPRMTKQLPEVFDLTEISQKKAKAIIDYMVKWDGHINQHGNYYFSNTDKSAVDFYQAICVLAGYRARQSIQVDNRSDKFNDVHRLYILFDSEIGTQQIKKTYLQYTGKVHCVRVPKGNIVVRGNGMPLVIGNCHLSIAKTRKDILDHYKESVIVGLTATPARGDGRGLGEIYDDLVQSISMRDLIEQGHLVPMRYFAPTKPDLRKLKTSKSDYVVKELGERMDQPKLVGDVIDNWLKICPDRQTVVFCVTRSHARHIWEAFEDAGVSAGYLDGDTPLDERAKILEDIADGTIQVLVNIFVATFGWDCPPVSCVILARPTKNITLYLQTAGRGLRPFDGKDDCILIDHSGAVEQHGFIDDLIPWTLSADVDIREEKKKQQKEKVEPKDITCKQCKTVFRSARECPSCGYVMIKPGKPIPVHKATLKELTSSGKATIEDKQVFWNKCIYQASYRNMKCGAAAHIYKRQFGVWPRGLDRLPKGSQWKLLAKEFLQP